MTHVRVFFAAALLLVGCGDVAAECDDPVACTCAPSRSLSSGVCCPAWTTAGAGETCEPRSFVLPSPGQTIGGPAARRLSLALDGEGRAFVAWEQAGTGAADEVVVAEETLSLVFSTRKPGAALSGLGTLPAVVAGARGDVVVAFRQSTAGDGGDIHLSQRSPEGVWSDPQSAADRVSFGEKAYEPRLAARPSGETLLVWNQWYASEHYGVALASRPSPGAPWVFPAGEDDVLSAPSFFSNGPQIAVNARGDALSCWYQAAGTELMVFKSEREGPDGVFSRPTLDDFVSAKGGEIDSDPVANPKPAVADDGRAAIVWTQANASTKDVAVYLATRAADGSWTRPASIDDTFSRPHGKCRDARAAFDTLGGLYVVWSQDEGDGSRVYLALRGFDGSWIVRGDEAILLSSGGAEAINPVLAVGHDGQVLVAWSERQAEFFRVAAARGSASGFGAAELLSPEGEHGLSPAVAVGGPGDRGVVAWLAGDPPLARIHVAAAE